MTRPVLPEWSGEKLRYLSPRATMHRLGYRSPGERPDLTPAERECFAAIEARVGRQDGAPAPEVTAFESELAAADAVKAWALELGADVVGITALDQLYVYEGCDLAHDFVIVFGVAMDYREILRVPRPESNVEYLRVYDAVSRVGVELAERIRARGYRARAHTLRDEQLAMLPHAQAAGLGELGKHGSLINRELGCSFRVGAVTTDLPLAVDTPRDEGIHDFCSSCRMCVSYCPGDAISDETAVVRGVEKWVVDTARCAPYFSEHYACAICLQVCPINAKAFGGEFRDDFVRTIRELDPEELRKRLDGTT